MKLIKFRIQNYKSIRDSGWCYLASDITILAGQNESGKSAVLEALRDFDKTAGIPADAFPVDSNDTPVIEMCFEVDEELRSKLGYEMVSEEMWAHISEHGLKIIKYHDGRYELGAEIDELLNKQREKIESALIEVEKTVEDLSEIETISRIARPEISAGDLAATRNSVARYIDTIQPYFRNFHFDSLRKENKALVGENQPGQFLNSVKECIPNFIFFSDRGVLPYEIAFQEAKDNPPHSVQDFMEIINLDLDEVINAPDSQKRRMILRQHSTEIPREFLHCWKQCKLELSLGQDAGNLVFDITESGNAPLFKPEQRSKGLQWFLSFYLHLKAKQGGKNILLIDEPGLYLHANAQKDVLEVLEKVSCESQVVFSTHSPYLIDTQRLDRVRLISKSNKEGTRIENKIHRNTAGRAEALTPIVTAIGLDLSNSFSIVGKKNVLLEGISDYYFLQAFHHNAKTSGISLVPGTGAPNIPQLVSLLIGWGLEFLVVLDNDGEGIRVADKLKDKLTVEGKRIVFVSEREESSTEDLFTHEDFNEFVLDETTANKDPEVKNSKFLKNEGLDKVLLAKKFFEKTDKAKEDGKEIGLSNRTLNNFQRVFEKIDEELNQGQTVGQITKPERDTD